MTINRNQNELARHLKHDGVRVGEIITYRAWQVIHPWWFGSGDDRTAVARVAMITQPIAQRNANGELGG
jgi:hypothetical protein